MVGVVQLQWLLSINSAIRVHLHQFPVDVSTKTKIRHTSPISYLIKFKLKGDNCFRQEQITAEITVLVSISGINSTSVYNQYIARIQMPLFYTSFPAINNQKIFQLEIRGK